MAEKFGDSNIGLKQCFQHLFLEELKQLDSNVSPSLRAHNQRRIISQLLYSLNTNDANEDNIVCHAILQQYLHNYSKIVDEQDSAKGLNNYANGAMALAGSFKTENKLWSLQDLESCKQYQQLKNETETGNLPSVSSLDKTLDYISKISTAQDSKKSQGIVEVKTQSEIPVQPSFVKPLKIPEKKMEEPPKPNPFRTAREQLIVDQKKKNTNESALSTNSYGCRPKSLGPRRGLNSPFIPPIKDAKPNNDVATSNEPEVDKIIDERLKNIEPKMIELIENEIMDHGPPVNWDDIAGLEFAKATIKEIVVWPMLRPDIFTGLRGPPRGILLFGPPGTGKTLIGRCIASQSKSTFFSISASSLTSKWVGEGEKMVRALFAVARVHQPSVVFIDEIDSLLSQRSDTEHESSRRIKTEFLVQLDGATTNQEDRLLVVGATNRPQELDEAARRRLVKRLYIPLPEFPARKQIIKHLLSSQSNCLHEDEIDDICSKTEGYSGADMTNLCREAALGPIRSISMEDIHRITADEVRPIEISDFEAALCQVRASVSNEDMALYEDWNRRYGSAAK